MRYASMVVRLACAITPSLSKQTAEGPIDEKAQKTYKETSEYLHRRMTDAALDSFKKAPLPAMSEKDDQVWHGVAGLEDLTAAAADSLRVIVLADP
jgi:hypothetical protein